ncbi:hypothetical protein LTR12_015087 [Friedmanniomyces endolithicus]|nr:hypothetical protein LTR12_015087 [Friedmanniomyces endolithicus]
MGWDLGWKMELKPESKRQLKRVWDGKWKHLYLTSAETSCPKYGHIHMNIATGSSPKIEEGTLENTHRSEGASHTHYGQLVSYVIRES